MRIYIDQRGASYGYVWWNRTEEEARRFSFLYSGDDTFSLYESNWGDYTAEELEEVVYYMINNTGRTLGE